VHSGQDRRGIAQFHLRVPLIHVAENKRDVLQFARQSSETNCGEIAVSGRDPTSGLPVHLTLLPRAMPHDIGDSYHQQTAFASKSLELGASRHCPVVVDDLSQHADWCKPGKPAQVDRTFGVTSTLEHAAGSCAQREDVPRPTQLVGKSARLGKCPDGQCAIRCRHAGRCRVFEID
jgi:hypothetical protein